MIEKLAVFHQSVDEFSSATCCLGTEYAQAALDTPEHVLYSPKYSRTSTRGTVRPRSSKKLENALVYRPKTTLHEGLPGIIGCGRLMCCHCQFYLVGSFSPAYMAHGQQVVSRFANYALKRSIYDLLAWIENICCVRREPRNDYFHSLTRLKLLQTDHHGIPSHSSRRDRPPKGQCAISNRKFF